MLRRSVFVVLPGKGSGSTTREYFVDDDKPIRKQLNKRLALSENTDYRLVTGKYPIFSQGNTIAPILQEDTIAPILQDKDIPVAKSLVRDFLSTELGDSLLGSFITSFIADTRTDRADPYVLAHILARLCDMAVDGYNPVHDTVIRILFQGDDMSIELSLTNGSYHYFLFTSIHSEFSMQQLQTIVNILKLLGAVMLHSIFGIEASGKLGGLFSIDHFDPAGDNDILVDEIPAKLLEKQEDGNRLQCQRFRGDTADADNKYRDFFVLTTLLGNSAIFKIEHVVCEYNRTLLCAPVNRIRSESEKIPEEKEPSETISSSGDKNNVFPSRLLASPLNYTECTYYLNQSGRSTMQFSAKRTTKAPQKYIELTFCGYISARLRSEDDRPRKKTGYKGYFYFKAY